MENDMKNNGFNTTVDENTTNNNSPVTKNEDTFQVIPYAPDAKNSKPYQYLTPNNFVYVPMVLYEIRNKIADRFQSSIGGQIIPTDGTFWDWFCQSELPLVLTEGEGKDPALLSIGIPAIALYSVSYSIRKVKNSYELKPELQPFITKGRVVVIAMDNDSNESETAQRKNKIALKRLTQAIETCEAKPYIMQWSADYKGIDDLIVKNPSMFEARFLEALSPQSQSKMKRMLNQLEYKYGSRLRFNNLSQFIELDGHELDLDTVKVFWAEKFGEDQPTENIIQSLLAYSKKNAYDPVKDWLLEIESSNLPSKDFDCIASKYLGNDSRLANIYLKKTMIGAVARVFEPGCKLDTCTVLQGKQGLGKSSFWAALAGKSEFFDDSLSAHGGGDKDEKLKIARFWILELAELESLYRRKDVSSVRSLLTSSSDNIRPPYGRQMKCFPRRSIFVGSVNPADFLADSEGNRRFWVVPVEHITLPSVDEVRGLYAAAIQAYRAGEKWYLTSEEEQLQQEHNKDFEQSEPWEYKILEFCSDQEYVSIPDILSQALQIPLGQQEKRYEIRVSKVLSRAGYTRKVKKVGKKSVRLWLNPDEVVTQMVTKV
jgi:predicted P-loop ATPase